MLGTRTNRTLGAATLACTAALALALCPLGARAALADAEADHADELQEVQGRINESNVDYEEAVARVEELQAQIDANEARIAELEQELPAQREEAAASMRSLYRMQQSSGGLVELLLSADNFNELLTTIQYLDVIQSHNASAVSDLVAASEELEQTRSALELQMQEAEAERDRAAEALAAATAARQELQARIEAQAAAEAAERQAAIEAAKAEEGQTFVTESGNEAEVETPSEGSTGAGSIDWNMSKEEFVSSWGARIDAYLAGSPLAGYGTTFAEAAWEYSVDPRFSPAISMVESSQGRYCYRPYNAWGWGGISWSSWEEAIWAHTAGLASGYGGTLTYAGALKYCPPNADNWYASVLANMQRI